MLVSDLLVKAESDRSYWADIPDQPWAGIVPADSIKDRVRLESEVR